MIPMKIPLHDYQVYAKDFLITHPYCGLFLKMGLGKTSIVLEALWELNPSEHVLIIAPKNIARVTWTNEIKKWGMPFKTKSLVVNEKGKPLTKAKRDKILDAVATESPTVYFVNRDIVTTLVKRFPGRQWPFRTVIIDESQSFKAYTAARFKAMKTVRPYIGRVVELTGSPAPKGLEDLWSQIWLLDMGDRLGKTITSFRERWFNPGIIMNNYPVTWRLKWGAEQEIYDRIGDIVISMRNDRIKLPPITYNPVMIPLDEDERKLYKQLMKDSVLELGDGTVVEAANAAVLQAKLSQMASGALYKQSGSHEYEVIHEKKLEMTDYIIDNTPDNVVIAYHFQSDLDMLMNYLKAQGREPVKFDGTPEMELAWNRKEIPILLIQPASCGFGLNLQEGGSTLVWYTLPWSLEEYEQTIARLHRQGQVEPVVIHQLMVENTIDAKILKALELKDIGQERLIDAVEAAIAEA